MTRLFEPPVERSNLPLQVLGSAVVENDPVGPASELGVGQLGSFPCTGIARRYTAGFEPSESEGAPGVDYQDGINLIIKIPVQQQGGIDCHVSSLLDRRFDLTTEFAKQMRMNQPIEAVAALGIPEGQRGQPGPPESSLAVKYLGAKSARKLRQERG